MLGRTEDISFIRNTFREGNGDEISNQISREKCGFEKDVACMYVYINYWKINSSRGKS
jgi:hypothetical protein